MACDEIAAAPRIETQPLTPLSLRYSMLRVRFWFPHITTAEAAQAQRPLIKQVGREAWRDLVGRVYALPLRADGTPLPCALRYSEVLTDPLSLAHSFFLEPAWTPQDVATVQELSRSVVEQTAQRHNLPLAFYGSELTRLYTAQEVLDVTVTPAARAA